MDVECNTWSSESLEGKENDKDREWRGRYRRGEGSANCATEQLPGICFFESLHLHLFFTDISTGANVTTDLDRTRHQSSSQFAAAVLVAGRREKGKKSEENCASSEAKQPNFGTAEAGLWQRLQEGLCALTEMDWQFQKGGEKSQAFAQMLQFDYCIN